MSYVWDLDDKIYVYATNYFARRISCIGRVRDLLLKLLSRRRELSGRSGFQAVSRAIYIICTGIPAYRL